MIEKQPQILFSTQARLNAATSGPSSRHMMSGLVSIDRPCSAYSGNTTRSMVDRLRRALPTIARIFSVCRARSSGVFTTGSCNCTIPITTPLGDLFSPPSPLIGGLFDDAQFAGRARQGAARGAGGDHDAQRQHVGRRVEQVVARGDADRLQRGPERTGAAKEEGGIEAVDRVPARENHQ